MDNDNIKDENQINEFEETKDINEQQNDEKIERNYEEDIKLLKDQLLRAVAEGENIRKRMEKQIEDASKFAVTSFAKDLINVMENLQRTTENINDDLISNNESLRSIKDGIDMTKKELYNVFEKHGIKRIEPNKGDKFDHNYHQAVAHLADSEIEAGSILSVMQAGYIIKDRLLTPAMVSVSKLA